jgi:curved DNA-binding protein CbpA
MGEDYYALLGVRKDASAEQIKKGYRTEAIRHHPDKNPDNKEAAEERFKEIGKAYEVLMDEEKLSAARTSSGVGPASGRCRFQPAQRAPGFAEVYRSARVHVLAKAAEERAARYKERGN